MLIYKITNMINNKVYIGQTTKSLEQRLKTHKRDSISKNSYFYQAVRKYGWDNFSAEIIEDNITDIDTLNEREQYWIKYYNSFLDKTKGYNSTSGGKNYTMTREEREKRRYRVLGNKNPMYGKPSPNKGKKLSEEHKKKISLANKNNKRDRTSENNPSSKPIINITQNQYFDSITDACHFYNISHTAIMNHLKGKSNTCIGCKWRYAKKEEKELYLKSNSKTSQNNIKREKKSYYILEKDCYCCSAVEVGKIIDCDNSFISKKFRNFEKNKYQIIKGYHIKTI